MKKQVLLLAVCIMIFASCSNTGNDQSASQAQIDSLVNVKTAAIQAHTQVKNDSTINALARAKADSMIAAAKNVIAHIDTNKHKAAANNINSPDTGTPPSKGSKMNFLF